MLEYLVLCVVFTDGGTLLTLHYDLLILSILFGWVVFPEAIPFQGEVPRRTQGCEVGIFQAKFQKFPCFSATHLQNVCSECCIRRPHSDICNIWGKI